MNNKIQLISDETLKNLDHFPELKEAVIIDVREPYEYDAEHIAHSQNIPLSQLSAKDFTHLQNKPVIFHCRSGNRTRNAENVLLATGLKSIYCLPGGIEQWKRCGLSTQTKSEAGNTFDIFRQVQISVGILILLGILLGIKVSPYFLALSAIAGFGLFISGITGYCGMAKLLLWMPWNR